MRSDISLLAAVCIAVGSLGACGPKPNHLESQSMSKDTDKRTLSPPEQVVQANLRAKEQRDIDGVVQTIDFEAEARESLATKATDSSTTEQITILASALESDYRILLRDLFSKKPNSGRTCKVIGIVQQVSNTIWVAKQCNVPNGSNFVRVRLVHGPKGWRIVRGVRSQ